MTPPVAGFQTGCDSSLEPSTHSPPMNICARLMVVAMAPPVPPRPSGYSFRRIPGNGRTSHRAAARLYARANRARERGRLAGGEHVPGAEREEELHAVA